MTLPSSPLAASVHLPRPIKGTGSLVLGHRQAAGLWVPARVGQYPKLRGGLASFRPAAQGVRWRICALPPPRSLFSARPRLLAPSECSGDAGRSAAGTPSARCHAKRRRKRAPPTWTAKRPPTSTPLVSKRQRRARASSGVRLLLFRRVAAWGGIEEFLGTSFAKLTVFVGSRWTLQDCDCAAEGVRRSPNTTSAWP